MMNTRHVLGTTMLTLALASCGGGGVERPTEAPVNPATFTATAQSSNTVELTWTAVPNAANFTLDRKTNGGTYTELARNLPRNTLTYLDTNLAPDTTYTYRLRAFNSAGASSGVERAVTTPEIGDTTFTLSAQPATVNVQSGGNATITIQIARPQGASGNVTLSLQGSAAGVGPDKINGTFSSPANGTSTLALTVGEDVPVGTHTLTVHGQNGPTERTTDIHVNVERWLLVDDDRSTNNWPANNPNTPDSAADRVTRAALGAAGKAFDVVVVGYSASGQEADEPDGPNAAQLAAYSGVIWYTGARIENVITFDDLHSLARFLDHPQRTLLVFSPGLIHNAIGGRSGMQQPDAAFRSFLQTYAGVGQVAYPGVSATGFTLTGQAGAVTQGLNVSVTSSNRGFVLPSPNTQALFKEGGNVVTTGKANAGTAGSSQVVLAPFSIGHVAQGDVTALLGRFLNH